MTAALTLSDMTTERLLELRRHVLGDSEMDRDVRVEIERIIAERAGF